MARGWESKSVADQIEEGNSRAPVVDRRHSWSESRELEAKLQSLQLSKSRVLQQLERARLEAHRTVLLNGLKAIESEIDQIKAKLESS